MAKIIEDITVEVVRPNLFQAVVAKQNDCNSRFLKATFINKGEKIDITSASKVTLNARRPDGEAAKFDGTINDDATVTVPLHSWVLSVEGMVECDISVIDENDEKLTSTKFLVFVEKAACGDEDVMDDPQYDILTELIEQVKSLSPTEMDTELSETSENAVQNKAIAIAINDINATIGDIEVALDSIIALQNSLIGGDSE